MSDLELQQRNRQLADWTVRLDRAMSDVADDSRESAYVQLSRIRREIMELAIPTTVIETEGRRVA